MEDYLEFTFGSLKSRIVFADSKTVPVGEADLFVVDEHTSSFLPTRADRLVVIPSGEASKSWPSVSAILEKAVELKLTPKSVVMGIGGGVVCDLATFAASLLYGGTRLILVPTTLTAQADAAIGGNASLDVGTCRNLVSTHHYAERIFICPEFIAGLPETVFRSELAEVLKTGLVEGPKIVSDLEEQREDVLARKPEILAELVRRSIQVKGSIGMRAVRDPGHWQFIRFGHEFAHALETASGCTVSHGDAVAWGIFRAMKAGELLQVTDPAYATEVRSILGAYGFRTAYPEIGADALVEAMYRSRMRSGPGFTLVLQRDLCSNLTQDVDEAFLRTVLAD